jgi:hypothetical protein
MENPDSLIQTHLHHRHHHHHHHHVSIKELGHLFTRSRLTHTEVSSMVFLVSFAFWGVVFLVLIIILYPFLSFYVLSKIGVIFNFFAISVFVFRFVLIYPAVILAYFISAAVILVASLALMVQLSLPYNKDGRASVLYNFILRYKG